MAFASIPWDIGEAQPAVVALERAGRFRGAVVDVGCGLGDNAIYLASKGYRVTGLDVAPTAVERARQRAEGQPVDVEFAVADATALADTTHGSTVFLTARVTTASTKTVVMPTPPRCIGPPLLAPC